jgi:hypothetical protein
LMWWRGPARRYEGRAVAEHEQPVDILNLLYFGGLPSSSLISSIFSKKRP